MASPFPPASQVPLQRNPPLAPSQELAYRKKCIDLRRRLTEIEQQNDTIRSRINRERAFHDKARLNRAILLQHLKEVIEGASLSPEEIESLKPTGSGGNLAEHIGYSSTVAGIDLHARSQYVDDETEVSGEEELPEPQERPLRSKRAQNYARDQSIPHNQAPSGSVNGTPYNAPSQPTTLPQLAPSPAPPHPTEAPTYTSSKVRTPPASYNLPPPQPSSAYSPSLSHPHPPHPYYGHAAPPSSAAQQSQQPPHSPYATNSPTHPTGPPLRPSAPIDSFINQSISTLLNNGLSEGEAVRELSHDWHNLSASGQRPWILAYESEMQRYEYQKDEWKRQNKASSSGQGGFRAVNQ